MKFKKKPVVIEAFRMGIESSPEWFQDKVNENEIVVYYAQGGSSYDSFKLTKAHCEIKTLEGVMRGDYGDYIIKGVAGEVYPCKPDIFEFTYERVEE
ncbi:hypothetical protein SAMN04487895_101546 [Paenibacillus sophorae]|uniref:Phage protein n=1 Tax=Paenibacillus sophorae TaxID=1333845 RepID=A0A1H8GJF7_9BACL|nr:hypothetical protein [Paenibacillus sophorae]QWU14254.1 hypothetical protein KP014_20300 [Paenibacillus sophorae]SEN44311.1 hypothetical protein SAMN04487895_101546 [Paenibacillus sophorae]